jgi:gluconokinase
VNQGKRAGVFPQPGTARPPRLAPPTVIVLTGVTGAGKTTVGQRLAQSLDWAFYDADAFHPLENVERMRTGEPLADEHREPWLAALAALIAETLNRGESAVLACSALRARYRAQLAASALAGPGEVRFVLLSISRETARQRLEEREGHFMPASLVDSQFDELESAPDVLVLDATHSVDRLAAEIRRWLGV